VQYRLFSEISKFHLPCGGAAIIVPAWPAKARPRIPRPRRPDDAFGETPMKTDDLLESEPRVINVGLRSFADDLASCNVSVVHVDWSPPAVTDPRIASLLAKLGG
jgi:FdrA protein